MRIWFSPLFAYNKYDSFPIDDGLNIDLNLSPPSFQFSLNHNQIYFHFHWIFVYFFRSEMRLDKFSIKNRCVQKALGCSWYFRIKISVYFLCMQFFLCSKKTYAFLRDSERPTKEKSEWMSDRERHEVERVSKSRKKQLKHIWVCCKRHEKVFVHGYRKNAPILEMFKQNGDKRKKWTIQHFNKDNSNGAHTLYTHTHAKHLLFRKKRREKSEMLVSKVYHLNNWAEEFIEWFALAAYQSRRFTFGTHFATHISFKWLLVRFPRSIRQTSFWFHFLLLPFISNKNQKNTMTGIISGAMTYKRIFFVNFSSFIWNEWNLWDNLTTLKCSNDFIMANAQTVGIFNDRLAVSAWFCSHWNDRQVPKKLKVQLDKIVYFVD